MRRLLWIKWVFGGLCDSEAQIASYDLIVRYGISYHFEAENYEKQKFRKNSHDTGGASALWRHE